MRDKFHTDDNITNDIIAISLCYRRLKRGFSIMTHWRRNKRQRYDNGIMCAIHVHNSLFMYAGARIGIQYAGSRTECSNQCTRKGRIEHRSILWDITRRIPESDLSRDVVNTKRSPSLRMFIACIGGIWIYIRRTMSHTYIHINKLFARSRVSVCSRVITDSRAIKCRCLYLWADTFHRVYTFWQTCVYNELQLFWQLTWWYTRVILEKSLVWHNFAATRETWRTMRTTFTKWLHIYINIV